MRVWLLGRAHISWAICFAAFGFLAGAGIILLLPVAVFSHIGWAIFGMVLFIICAIRRLRILLLGAFVAGMCVGIWRGAVELHDLGKYSPFYDSTVQAQGVVAEDAVQVKGSWQIQLSAIAIQGQNLRGSIWATTPQASLKRGDKVAMEGKLRRGFGNFPASFAMARVIFISHQPDGDPTGRLRDWFAAKVRTALPEPEASLGIGFLTGQQSALPDELDRQLRLLGLTHIVVASGYNLAILVRLARRSFAKTSKYLATVTAVAMTIGFVLMAGFSPSMVRAALVTALSLAAWYYGRAIHPLVLLSIVAAGTVAAAPSSLWGDVGWHLSFASFAGVILLAPLIHRYFWGDRQAGAIRQVLVETSSAQLATLPIIALVFGQYSPLSLLANALILPLVPLGMLLTFLAGVVSSFVPAWATAISWPAVALLRYITSLTNWLSTWPMAQGEVRIGPVWFAIAYGIIVAALLWLWYTTKYNFRKQNLLE